MKRPTLTAPFKVVEKVNGMDYIPIAEVLDRLNTVLGTGKWSYACNAWRDEHDPEFVIAKGQFTVHALNDAGIASCLIEQYGGQKINRKSGGGDIIDLGNDFKGAASDALKKCAMAIGVALYLPLGRPPHMAAQFEAEQKGEPKTGAEDDGDQSGTGGQEGNGSSSPAALTPGFSGEKF